MNDAAKNDHARNAIESAVKTFLGAEKVRKVVVSPIDDYSGDPSLYVNVHMSPGDALPSIEQRAQLRDAIRRELGRLEDDRFPYVSVIGSYWDADPQRKLA